MIAFTNILVRTCQWQPGVTDRSVNLQLLLWRTGQGSFELLCIPIVVYPMGWLKQPKKNKKRKQPKCPTEMTKQTTVFVYNEVLLNIKEKNYQYMQNTQMNLKDKMHLSYLQPSICFFDSVSNSLQLLCYPPSDANQAQPVNF